VECGKGDNKSKEPPSLRGTLGANIKGRTEKNRLPCRGKEKVRDIEPTGKRGSPGDQIKEKISCRRNEPKKNV